MVSISQLVEFGYQLVNSYDTQGQLHVTLETVHIESRNSARWV